MSERITETKTVVSTSDLFSAASKFISRGVLIEEKRNYSVEYRGIYADGDQSSPIAISIAEFVGYESITISTDGAKATVKKVTQPNTSPAEEYSREDEGNLPEDILQILARVKDDREAMKALQT